MICKNQLQFAELCRPAVWGGVREDRKRFALCKVLNASTINFVRFIKQL